LASDLSPIIKEDISNTLESLLSATATINSTDKASTDDLSGKQCIKVETDFEFSKFETVRIKFYIPSHAATKFEYLMLGGIGDLKDAIDDEISDAVNEIVSNICGSISTNINAQGFDDLGSMKFSIVKNEILQCDDIGSLDNVYRFDMALGDDKIELFLDLQSSLLPYVSGIATGQETEAPIGATADMAAPVENVPQNAILSLLGEESIENLKLLFDIKFKLSVRLGTKIVLLKDITSWDTGTIIELEQMVNEPLDILANGIKIGEGEAVIVEGKFGIKIKHIGDKRLG